MQEFPTATNRKAIMHTLVWVLAITAYTLATCLTASLAVSIYLHRYLTHKSIELGVDSVDFFRFVIWFITGMEPSEWKVVHLSHHQAPADSPGDVHSPKNEGLLRIIFFGVWYYMKATLKLRPQIAQERLVTADALDHWAVKRLGIAANLLLNIWLWGFWAGLIVWIIQIIWIPFWAAGVINGLGHSAHDEDPRTHDHSKDILEGWPKWMQNTLNVITGGESRHHAHHLKAGSARFTTKDEFDFGYSVIRMLGWFDEATVIRE
jgi:stearoyl-CoA desaturase (Delta-9 desaturase)